MDTIWLIIKNFYISCFRHIVYILSDPVAENNGSASIYVNKMDYVRWKILENIKKAEEKAEEKKTDIKPDESLILFMKNLPKRWKAFRNYIHEGFDHLIYLLIYHKKYYPGMDKNELVGIIRSYDLGLKLSEIHRYIDLLIKDKVIYEEKHHQASILRITDLGKEIYEHKPLELLSPKEELMSSYCREQKENVYKDLQDKIRKNLHPWGNHYPESIQRWAEEHFYSNSFFASEFSNFVQWRSCWYAFQFFAGVNYYKHKVYYDEPAYRVDYLSRTVAEIQWIDLYLTILRAYPGFDTYPEFYDYNVQETLHSYYDLAFRGQDFSRICNATAKVVANYLFEDESMQDLHLVLKKKK